MENELIGFSSLTQPKAPPVKARKISKATVMEKTNSS